MGLLACINSFPVRTDIFTNTLKGTHTHAYRHTPHT